MQKLSNFVVFHSLITEHASLLLPIVVVLFAQVLVLFERNGKAQHTEKVLKAINALKEPLTNDKQMWSAGKTLKFLLETCYSHENLPETLKGMQEEHLMAKDDASLALKALGGCLW